MTLLDPAPLAAVMDVVRATIMVLFVVCSLLMVLVILAQEGKGGGLAGAFGGAGAETFGVKAGAVNKFTAWLAGFFLGLALLHAGLSTAAPAPSTISTEEFDAGAGDGTEARPADGDGDAQDGDAQDGDTGNGDAESGDAKEGDAGDDAEKKKDDTPPGDPPKDD